MVEHTVPRSLERETIIREQCSFCRYYNDDNQECHFAVEYGWNDQHSDVQWYRDNDPEAIEVTQDCLVFPASPRIPRQMPVINQQ